MSLEPDTTYYWTDRIWDKAGTASTWSDPARFTTTLPDDDHWDGEWAGVDEDSHTSLVNTEQNYLATLHEAETLGQTFTIADTFEIVSARFPTWRATDSSLTVSLYKGPQWGSNHE